MAIEFKKNVAVCTDVCTIEEAESLLEWLLDHPKGKLNMKQCTHLHTAILQVLMAVTPGFSSLPEHKELKTVLIAASLLEEY